jgi:hypothetical protein
MRRISGDVFLLGMIASSYRSRAMCRFLLGDHDGDRENKTCKTAPYFNVRYGGAMECVKCRADRFSVLVDGVDVRRNVFDSTRRGRWLVLE